MSSSDPTPRQSRRDSAIAFGIMFFSLAVLCFLLGWADGVRHGRAMVHLPTSGGWLVTTAILAALGVLLLVWSRSAKRG